MKGKMNKDYDNDFRKQVENDSKCDTTRYRTLTETIDVGQDAIIEGGRYDGAKIIKMVTVDMVEAMELPELFESGDKNALFQYMEQYGTPVVGGEDPKSGLDLVVLFEQSKDGEMGFHSALL
jgi:hypothetical protein